jgi:hypothetical protein
MVGMAALGALALGSLSADARTAGHRLERQQFQQCLQEACGNEYQACATDQKAANPGLSEVDLANICAREHACAARCAHETHDEPE